MVVYKKFRKIFGIIKYKRKKCIFFFIGYNWKNKVGYGVLIYLRGME